MHQNFSLDIDRLNEAELIALNLRVVARLRLMWQTAALRAMQHFRIGEKVVVPRHGQSAINGVITRFNKNTVSIVTHSHQRWNVSPWLLRKAESEITGRRFPPNVALLDPTARRRF
jgi:hypothetical protein